MFYLTTHSTHFVYGYMASVTLRYQEMFIAGRKEGNVSFNDALNTFYLRLYGVGYTTLLRNVHSWKERRKCFI